MRGDGRRLVGHACADASGSYAQNGEWTLDHIERLRCLAINDSRLSEPDRLATEQLDLKAVTLVRLAALVAVGGAVPSFGAHTDAAVSAGATVSEIVDVLVSVVPVVGLPCVVNAAPRVAMALGFDIDEDTELGPAV